LLARQLSGGKRGRRITKEEDWSYAKAKKQRLIKFILRCKVNYSIWVILVSQVFFFFNSGV
jgi:hypothetical protein